MADSENTDGPGDTNVSPVVFVDTEPVKAPSSTAVAIAAAKAQAAALAAPSGEPVKVRVIAPYLVAYQGRRHVGGDTVEVPAATANHWLKNKWVELVPTRSKPAQKD
jgi:hypothetical protein